MSVAFFPLSRLTDTIEGLQKQVDDLQRQVVDLSASTAEMSELQRRSSSRSLGSGKERGGSW